MTSDDLDRILASKDFVRPSPAFTQNVMAAIHREAAELPRPLFPWIRFGIGITASGVMAGSATVLVTALPMPALSVPSALAPELACAIAALLIGLGMAAVPRVLFR